MKRHNRISNFIFFLLLFCFVIVFLLSCNPQKQLAKFEIKHKPLLVEWCAERVIEKVVVKPGKIDTIYNDVFVKCDTIYNNDTIKTVKWQKLPPTIITYPDTIIVDRVDTMGMALIRANLADVRADKDKCHKQRNRAYKAVFWLSLILLIAILWKLLSSRLK